MFEVLIWALVILQDAPRRPLAPSVMLVPISPDYLAVDFAKAKSIIEPGFKLSSLEEGVAFDVDGDGDLDHVSWTERGADVAFLALDVDADGRITSGKELFGNHMLTDAMTGADALIAVFQAREGALSGSVHEGHELYEKLLLWVDRNHNGISEHLELRPAKELFTAVGMGFLIINKLDEHGNRFWLQGWTEVRTAGPEQGRPTNRRDHFPRVRQMFEVALRTR